MACSKRAFSPVRVDGFQNQLDFTRVLDMAHRMLPLCRALPWNCRVWNPCQYAKSDGLSTSRSRWMTSLWPGAAHANGSLKLVV
jgi:ABC-type antimicrobial peptide transport system ATPase subunit